MNPYFLHPLYGVNLSNMLLALIVGVASFFLNHDPWWWAMMISVVGYLMFCLMDRKKYDPITGKRIPYADR